MNDPEPAQQGAEVDTDPHADGPRPRPRVRWGAVTWGLMLGAAAVATTLIGTDDARREQFVAGLLQLTPAAILLVALVAIGGVILIVAALHLVSQAQTGRSGRG